MNITRTLILLLASLSLTSASCYSERQQTAYLYISPETPCPSLEEAQDRIAPTAGDSGTCTVKAPLSLVSVDEGPVDLGVSDLKGSKGPQRICAYLATYEEYHHVGLCS